MVVTVSSERSGQDGHSSFVEQFVSYNKSSKVWLEMSISGTYSAGLVLGGTQIIHDDKLGRPYDGASVRTVMITDKDGLKGAFNIHFFDEMPTIFADKDPYVPTDEDDRKRARTLSIETVNWVEDGGKTYYDLPLANAEMDFRDGTKSTFYVIVVSLGDYEAVLGQTYKFLSWID